MESYGLCDGVKLLKCTVQSRWYPQRHAVRGLKGCSDPFHSPFPPPICLSPSCHIYHCCRLLIPPQLVIQTQISPTYPRILCFSRPLTSKLFNTARLCVAARRRWNTNSLGLLQTQSQRLLAMATHPQCTTQEGLSHSKYVCVTIKLCVGVCMDHKRAFQECCMFLNILVCCWPF